MPAVPRATLKMPAGRGGARLTRCQLTAERPRRRGGRAPALGGVRCRRAEPPPGPGRANAAMPSEKSFKQRRTFGERPGEGRGGVRPAGAAGAAGLRGDRCGGEGSGPRAVGAARDRGRLLLTAGTRGRSGPGAVPVSRPARGCGGVKPGPCSGVVYPGVSGHGGFVVWRAVLCRARLRRSVLGVGRCLHGIIYYRLQDSQEPGNILGVCARSWACPSLRCLLSVRRPLRQWQRN